MRKVIQRLCQLVEELANKSIEKEDIFKIGLSGGSLTKYLSQGLVKINTDWSKWRIFFCDERVVPIESKDSTYGIYKNDLFTKIPITEEQIIKINPNLTAEEAAKDYIQKMSVHFPPDSLPKFHLLLLGVGPDGHTCSLFPEHRLLDETSVWVASINNSPKPPPSRITLTFPVINNSENCIFALAGSGKSTIIKKILKDNEKLPAARVNPTDGQVYWLMDKEAGISLKSDVQT